VQSPLERFMKQKICSVLLLMAIVFTSCNTNINGEVNKEKFVVTFSTEGGGTITASVDGKEITSGESVKEGTTIEFKALFDEKNYEVDRWVKAQENTFDKTRAKLKVAEDVDVKVIIVNKKPFEVTVNFSSDSNGSIVAMTDNRTLHSGDKVIKDTHVSFRATPNPGYKVSSWTGATIDGVDNTQAMAIAKTDLNVSVVFTPISPKQNSYPTKVTMKK